MQITIDPEFQNWLPAYEGERMEGLEESILREGCRDPLVVWRNGKNILLDGHRRLAICKKHGLEYKVETVDLPSREHALLWMDENQVDKRNLPDEIRAMVWDRVYTAKVKLALEARNAAAGKIGGQIGGRGRPKEIGVGDDVSPTPIEEPVEPTERVRDEVLRRSHLPERKLRYAHELTTKAAEPVKGEPKYPAKIRKLARELIAKVYAEEITLADARRELGRVEIKENLESVEAIKTKKLKGTYDVFVIDPPWPMQKIEREERPNQSQFEYPIMKLEEIENEVGKMIDEHSAEACHVFLWTTQKFLPDAFKLLEGWGLNYVFTMVWHKPGGFQPIGLAQYNCEFALYARKGSPKFIDTKAFATCFEAPRAEHSAKPEEFYTTLRRVTAGLRLDMFNRREIAGFERWGKEAPRSPAFED